MAGLFPEAFARLEEVLGRLSNFGLQLKAKKCTFMQTEVVFLGHIVGCTVLACDPAKLSTVRDWHAQRCTTVCWLCRLLPAFCEFCWTRKTALSVADAFFQHVVCRFGMLSVIHSDQGREFENKVMQELCFLCGAHKTRTTPYNPESDGLVEHFNRTLLMMLAMFAGENKDDWDDLLPVVMMAYRSSVHESTGFSPYRLMTMPPVWGWDGWDRYLLSLIGQVPMAVFSWRCICDGGLAYLCLLVPIGVMSSTEGYASVHFAVTNERSCHAPCLGVGQLGLVPFVFSWWYICDGGLAYWCLLIGTDQ